MPKVQSGIPEPLRPYLFHGIDLSTRDGAAEAIADCPFCGGERKWYVSTKTGLWQCKVCTAQGNSVQFLRKLVEETGRVGSDLSVLQETRKLLSRESLADWGILCSPMTGEWLVPGYNPEGKLIQIYRYAKDWKTGRLALLATPGLSHGLHGVNLFDSGCHTVYVCEGIWDGIALWETLRAVKSQGGKLMLTGNESASILAGCSVLAVPGCNVFAEGWASLLAGKKVYLLYDNDHPVVKEGKVTERGGLPGMRRVCQVLSKAAELPTEVYYLRWGEQGYEPELPNGYDVRDWLTATAGDALKRAGAWLKLQERLAPVPSEWVHGGRPGGEPGSIGVEYLPCNNWKTLINAWRKSGLKWIDGLDRALAAALACIASTEGVGEQLWMRMISPPSGGKSTLCEALSVHRKYVYPKDTFTGLVSGFQIDREGSENLSLVKNLKNKTLVINDGDTMLRLPNRDQVFSQLRAFFSRNLRSQYGNKMSTDFEGSNTTIILAGTESLRIMDSTELGERFFDCAVVDEMDPDLEDEIGWAVANRAEQDAAYRSDGKLETRDSPELVHAKRLTGGYVGWLRENALDLVGGITFDPVALKTVQHLATFVSYTRARPGKRAEEKEHRELSFRLISQFVRLAKFLAVVLNRTSVDAEALRRVRAVAFDTARGRTLELLKRLYPWEEGLEMAAAAASLYYSEESEKKLLYFLRSIKALSYTVPVVEEGISCGDPGPQTVGNFKPRPRWKLTPRLRKLYEEVYTDA